MSPNPDYLKESLEREIGLLAELGLNGQELYLTEWNSTAFHRELTNDTLYKAAYIVKISSKISIASAGSDIGY